MKPTQRLMVDPEWRRLMKLFRSPADQAEASRQQVKLHRYFETENSNVVSMVLRHE